MYLYRRKNTHQKNANMTRRRKNTLFPADIEKVKDFRIGIKQNFLTYFEKMSKSNKKMSRMMFFFTFVEMYKNRTWRTAKLGSHESVLLGRVILADYAENNGLNLQIRSCLPSLTKI